MRIPPLTIKILLESNPPKSRIIIRRLAVFVRPQDLTELVRAVDEPLSPELPEMSCGLLSLIIITAIIIIIIIITIIIYCYYYCSSSSYHCYYYYYCYF